MSDLKPAELWQQMLSVHWNYLEAEESPQKLEERKKLESCLEQLLCIAQHDRKFYLPETALVLKKTVCEMEEFTAYKAIVGFEAVSQYANNLFAKPWRKEYRVLKMYSGFFQHEVKSNLIDYVRLFEAMGYRRISDEVLVLDGPICPDQVANVSRDAMTAYMECKIMEQIYAGLVKLGYSCSWQDVYRYREKYTGHFSQAIKGLALSIQEMHARKEKLSSTDNFYASNHHHLSQLPIGPQCANCVQCQMQLAQVQPSPHYLLHNNSCALHHSAQTNSNLIYGGLSDNSKMLASYPAANYQQHNYSLASMQHPQMSHSRSLEHYNNSFHSHGNPIMPHRHSFEQSCAAQHYQHQLQPHNMYETPYDCIDGISMGSSSASYAAVAATGSGNGNVNPSAYTHPYNVSGNRFPLPLNISNQLSSHYATPTMASCNGGKGDAYENLNMDSAGYASVQKSYACKRHQYQQQPPLPPMRQNSVNLIKQQPSLREHLIDFDEREPLTSHDFHAQLHLHNNAMEYDYEPEMYDNRCDRYTAQRAKVNAVNYAQSNGLPLQGQILPSDEMYSEHIYARPLPRSSKVVRGSMMSKLTDKNIRNLDVMQDGVDNNIKMQMELKAATNGDGDINVGNVSRRKYSDRDTSDLSYESMLDDFVHVGHSEYPASSPTQATKNKDGIGSFESWNYVFRNLDRSGAMKDPVDRNDLLMQSLDLDAENTINTTTSKITDRRRTNNSESKTGSGGSNNLGRQSNGEKLRTLEKTTTTAEKTESKSQSAKQDKSIGILKQQNANASSISTNNTNVNTSAKVKPKSVLKTTTTTTSSTSSSANNNNSTHNGFNSGNYNGNTSTLDRGKRTGGVSSKTTRSNSTKPAMPEPTTQVIIPNPNEWSCKFCTFLNPNKSRICEMCSHSKDFIPEAALSSTATYA